MGTVTVNEELERLTLFGVFFLFVTVVNAYSPPCVEGGHYGKETLKKQLYIYIYTILMPFRK